MVNGQDLIRVMESDNYVHGNHIRWARQFLDLTPWQLAKELRVKEKSILEFERVGGMLTLMPVEVEDRAKKFFIHHIDAKLKKWQK